MTAKDALTLVRGEVEAALQCATDDHTKYHLGDIPGMLDDVEKELAALRSGHVTTAYTLSQVVHAMRAAWIEWKHGGGAEAAMGWIENTLDGPDQIPQADDGTDAQAYFDRVMAEDRERETAARASL